MFTMLQDLFARGDLGKSGDSCVDRQQVTKKTFRHYRVLGKGGFGEVSELVRIGTDCSIIIFHPSKQ